MGPVVLDRPLEKGLHPLVDRLAGRDTPDQVGVRLCLLQMPVMPMALTNSSTELVEMPCT
jgi:hypothetical protein